MLTKLQTKRLDRLASRLKSLSPTKREAIMTEINQEATAEDIAEAKRLELENKTVYTPPELAELFGVRDITVRGWINDGLLRAANIGRYWRVSRPDLEEFWQSRGGGTLFLGTPEQEGDT